jgi:hypothetical protein
MAGFALLRDLNSDGVDDVILSVEGLACHGAAARDPRLPKRDPLAPLCQAVSGDTSASTSSSAAM